jgi:hypothetical protein
MTQNMKKKKLNKKKKTNQGYVGAKGLVKALKKEI